MTSSFSEAILSHLGAILAVLMAILGPSWAHLGPCGGYLEAILGLPEGPGGGKIIDFPLFFLQFFLFLIWLRFYCLGFIIGVMKVFLAVLGPSWAILVPTWAPRRHVFEL